MRSVARAKVHYEIESCERPWGAVQSIARCGA
jgi:hypothetical protein